MKIFIKIFAILVIAPYSANAHPVSFKDGFGVMPGYSPERSELELNYSFNSDTAAALNLIEIERDDSKVRFVLPQINHKFFRRNAPESQVNIYGSLGLGGVRENGDSAVAGLAALQADYETRRIYTLLYGEHIQTEELNLNRFRYRFGVAPYLANFEDLNTWFIGQVEYTPQLDQEWTFVPMVRFFYNNYLLEVGASLDGDPFVAGIFHF